MFNCISFNIYFSFGSLHLRCLVYCSMVEGRHEDLIFSLPGHYAVVEGKNVPCFVYVTFNNRIYVYYNLYLPQVESTSLIEAMGKLTETQQLLARLNINSK